MRILTLLILFILPSLASAQLRVQNEKGFLDLKGRVQTGYTHRFLPEGDDDHKKDRFRLKQARVQAKGEFYRDYNFKISLELSRQARAKDLNISWNPCESLELKMGQFKVPISKQRLQSSSRLLFVSRARVADDFVPGRDIGAMLSWRSEDDRYSFNAGAFTGRGSNTSEDDRHGLPLLAMRLEWTPLAKLKKGEGDVKRSRRFALGLGADLAWSKDGEPLGAPDKPEPLHSIDGRKLLYGADLTLKYKGFFLTTELRGASFKPEEGPEYYAAGWLFQLSYFMKSLRLEPKLAVSDLNPSDILEEDRESSLLMGLNFYPRKSHNLKLVLDYAQRFPEGSLGDWGAEGWAKDEIHLLVQLAFK